MLRSLITHRHTRSEGFLTEQHARRSSEAQSPNPLMSEEGTDESRYYRSAEFQQALVEAETERNLTQSLEQLQTPRRETNRLSRYLSRIEMGSKSSLSLPLSDAQITPEEKDVLKRRQSEKGPGSDTGISTQSLLTLLGQEGSGEGAEPERPGKLERRKSRINLEGLGPLIGWRRNDKREL